MLQEWSDREPPSRRERIGMRIYTVAMAPVIGIGAALALVSVCYQLRAIYLWLVQFLA